MLWGASGVGAAVATSTVVIVGYLTGSVPVAVLAGRRHGTDLRQVGDRNPGYWNAKEQLPRRAAAAVFAGDAAKGVLAGIAGSFFTGDGRWWLTFVGVGAAMVGHAFPVFAGFRGGRSVLTFAGGAFVLSPRAALLAVALLAVVWLVTRSFAWGARAAVFGFPVVQAFVDPRARVAATGCLMAIIGLRFAMAALADRRRTVVTPLDGPRRSGPATS